MDKCDKCNYIDKDRIGSDNCISCTGEEVEVIDNCKKCMIPFLDNVGNCCDTCHNNKITQEMKCRSFFTRKHI